MFDPNFYPTPQHVISLMLEGVTIQGKTILEPSAGKGDIVDFLNDAGALTVLACEKNNDLAEIVKTKAKFLKHDFLEVASDEVSHIDLIVMNPPFDEGDKHILHAWNIAPAGCKIIALANDTTISNTYSQRRKELKELISTYGQAENLGDCFSDAERKTGVEVALIVLIKPGSGNSQEFEGFFMDEEEEEQANGLISYNVIRDLVGRYVEAIKIFDDQLKAAEKMNNVTSGYFSVNIALNIKNNDLPTTRAEFKKSLQKSGWKFIFAKLNMEKFATKGLKEDINKFVEQQTEVPFTMKNIYKMLEIVIGTTEQRMDKAILEVFDRVTQHHHENRHNVEGWKTNSHYLLNKKFVLPNLVAVDKWNNGPHVNRNYGSNFDYIEDLIKAMAYLNGNNYDDMISLYNFLQYSYKVKTDGKYGNYNTLFSNLNNASHYCQNRQSEGKNAEIEFSEVCYGEFHIWGYFKIKCFKKGTIHFEFLDDEVWGRFNQRVSKIKGYPLFEKAPDKRTERQKQRASEQKEKPKRKANFTVLKTFKV